MGRRQIRGAMRVAVGQQEALVDRGAEAEGSVREGCSALREPWSVAMGMAR